MMKVRVKMQVASHPSCAQPPHRVLALTHFTRSITREKNVQACTIRNVGITDYQR
jgi:hypothetical protein